MLSIDAVVAKYRSLVDPEEKARKWRRDGWSEAAIAKFVADERDHARIDFEEQVARFREGLEQKSRVQLFAKYLGLFNSHERVEGFWYAIFGEPADIFWPVLLDVWSDCDDTWHWRSLMLDTLRQRRAQASPLPYFSEADREFYDGLPARVPIFRGSSRERVRGIAWTVDRAVAEGFAHGHRFIHPPDPVIAEAEVEKDAVFFVSTERKEAEVVVNPRRLRKLKVTTFERPPLRDDPPPQPGDDLGLEVVD